MIEPVAFGYNYQTAINNHFQKNVSDKQSSIQQKALDEFNIFLAKLKQNNIQVILLKDTLYPHTPDSIFPNNWFSLHEGTIIFYPMFAENRRKERRQDIISVLAENNYNVELIKDYTDFERKKIFLEGTGSMVLDREKKLAFASLSERTHMSVLEEFCKDLKYKPIIFNATHEIDGIKKPIYHTNVMLSIGQEYVLICLEAITCKKERQLVISLFSDKIIIEITRTQMCEFAGNALQLKSIDGEKKLVISQRGYDSLRQSQIELLKQYNQIIISPINTIETYGGGSARCMLAEVF